MALSRPEMRKQAAMAAGTGRSTGHQQAAERRKPPVLQGEICDAQAAVEGLLGQLLCDFFSMSLGVLASSMPVIMRWKRGVRWPAMAAMFRCHVDRLLQRLRRPAAYCCLVKCLAEPVKQVRSC